MEEDKKRRELSTSSRQAAYCCLYSQSNDGVLEKGALTKTAKMFSVDRSTMGRLWRKINKKIEEHPTVTMPTDILTKLLFFESHNRDRGRHPKWDRQQLRKEIKETVPYRERKTFRNLVKATQVPKSTLHDMFTKEGMFWRHTSSLCPYLTEENKVARFMHALEEVYPVAGEGGVYKYKTLYNRVDVDKKWFYLTRARENYILITSADDNDDSDNEEDPNRCVRHWSHINKVMFLCAQARPRWDRQKNQQWDGKIGIWPVGHWAPAEQSSVNCEAGTPVWRDKSITKDKYRELLLEKVIPSIAEKWP